MMFRVVIAYSLLCFLISFSTVKSEGVDADWRDYDILLDNVELRPLNTLDQVRYYYLKRQVLRVLPYLNYTKRRYLYLTDTVPLLKGRIKKNRKLYIKYIKKEIKQNLEEKMKRLSVLEGKILIKLIHREIGITVYDLLKEVKNNFTAFWYNTGAKFYKMSLKDKLDLENRDDSLLNRIMIMEELPLE